LLIPHKVKNKGKYISFHYLRGWKARKIRKVQEISPQIPIYLISINIYFTVHEPLETVELQDCLSAFCPIKFSPNTLTSNPLTQFALSNPRLQPDRNFAVDMFP